MGRPSTYSRVIVPAVKAAAHFGATRAEIADYLGVSRQCFAQWCAENEELNNVLKRGSEASDNRVVESLYHQAIAGNPTCIVFWLKNRRPHEWRDVQHLDQAVGHYILSNAPMTEDEWIAARTKTIESKVVATTLSPGKDDTDKPLD